MKLLACLIVALVAVFTLPACTTDAHGRRVFDPVKAGQILDTTSRVLDGSRKALDGFEAAPPAIPAVTQGAQTIRVKGGEWRWQEHGYIWCPDLSRLRVTVPARFPDDMPASWRETLYDGDAVIEPLVVLNGKAVDL